MPEKVLIAAAEVHPLIPETFHKWGFETDIRPAISRDELMAVIHQYSGLIFTTYTQVDQTLMDAAPLLRFAGRVGSGMENADKTYAQSKGIALFNSPEGNANAVGEHALGMLLALMNNIVSSQKALQQNQWQREIFRGEELDGKTVGIIGYGHTGPAFARKLRGFDVKVLAYDKYRKSFETDFVKESTLSEILEKADVISFHVPLTPETKQLLNSDLLAQMKQKPYIINTSRGEVADSTALLSALEQAQIRGLCIDVWEDEPPFKAPAHQVAMYQKIMAHPKVVATSHIAGWTIESKYQLAAVLMKKIGNYLGKS